jgi:hypothetical protein
MSENRDSRPECARLSLCSPRITQPWAHDMECPIAIAAQRATADAERAALASLPASGPALAVLGPALLDALAAWRGLSEKQRANAISNIETGTPLYSDTADIVSTLLYAAAVIS